MRFAWDLFWACVQFIVRLIAFYFGFLTSIHGCVFARILFATRGRLSKNQFLL